MAINPNRTPRACIVALLLVPLVGFVKYDRATVSLESERTTTEMVAALASLLNDQGGKKIIPREQVVTSSAVISYRFRDLTATLLLRESSVEFTLTGEMVGACSSNKQFRERMKLVFAEIHRGLERRLGVPVKLTEI